MQTLNYWKQFENTGRIEDYLSYREECQGRQGAEGMEDAGALGAGARNGEAGADRELCRSSYM